MKLLLSAISCLLFVSAIGQNPIPPCGNDYGNASDENAIIQQMRFGTILDAQNAIAQAKNTRGYALGCPQISYNHNIANYSQPALSNIVSVWNTEHRPSIESFTINCPRIGRYENNAALGAYYATLAGYPVDLQSLKDIALMQIAQQYTSENVTNVDPLHEGVYGYINVASSDPCYPGGVVGSSVQAVCAAAPALCTTYDNGLFAGESFLVGDQYDPLSFYDGGIAYDHGWVGTHLIEAAIQQSDVNFKLACKNSVELAGQWALNQEVVKNHNYTAKLIWLLSEMYLWTGDSTYKNELNYKLDKNLLPGILIDENLDGFADGTSPSVAFQDLTSVATVPGRMWDGHNSLPWYSAMNAWALTEAYVAFRDRGDLVRAQELKPYAIAMLNNLSWEINNLGVIDDQLGVRDLTYALLLGIWKIAQYENEPHPDWESASWALWNAGYFDTYSTHSVCVGLYLCVLTQTPYQPLFDRENFLSLEEVIVAEKIRFYPNPTNHKLYVSTTEELESGSITLFDSRGSIVLEAQVSSSNTILNLAHLQPGIYYCQVIDPANSLVVSEKIIRH
jgi:hypothetical protein